MASGSRRRGRIFIYLALFLVLIVVLAWALLRNNLGGAPLTNQLAETPAAQAMVNIVVTTQQVAKGTELTDAVLTTIPYPKQNIGSGTFYTNISDVVGKKAKIDLDAKMPITSTLVVDKSGGSIAAFSIPKGMVAVSIPIDRFSSVSYAVQAGDHVNVIITMLLKDLDTNFQTQLPNLTAGVITPGPEAVTSSGDIGKPGAVSVFPVHQNLMAEIAGGGPSSLLGRAETDTSLGQPVYVVPSESQRPRMVSQSLLQDVIVLGVGEFKTEAEIQAAAQPTPTAAPGQQNGNQQQAAAAAPPAPPTVMTLIVTPQDALTLNFLMNNDARLTLALRGAGDDQRVKTEAVTLQYLMDQYNIPVPAKLPYGMEAATTKLRGTTIDEIAGEPTAAPR